MSRHGGALVISMACDWPGAIGQPRDEMPLLLVEPHAAVGEADVAPVYHAADIIDPNADLLENLALRGILRGLASLDASAGQVPVAAPHRVRIAQQQDSIRSVKQCQARYRSLLRLTVGSHASAYGSSVTRARAM